MKQFKVSGGMADPSLHGVIYERKGNCYLRLSSGEKFLMKEDFDSLFGKYGRGFWETVGLVGLVRDSQTMN